MADHKQACQWSKVKAAARDENMHSVQCGVHSHTPFDKHSGNKGAADVQ